MHNHLADKRQTTLILRLVVDKREKFLHGEVVDLEGKVIGRFAEWAQLTLIICSWLDRQVEQEET